MAGTATMGAKDPADAIRTFQKSSSFRASFAAYLRPWYPQKNLQVEPECEATLSLMTSEVRGHPILATDRCYRPPKTKQLFRHEPRAKNDETLGSA